MRALLLDLGGTAFRAAGELMGPLAERLPAARGVLARRGPFGPERDGLWEAMLREEITEREYWARRAAEVGDVLGHPGWTVRDLMAQLYADGDALRPEAAALVADVRAAGLAVGVLTNDLRAFHGEDALAGHPLIAQVDALVDGSVTGVLKPDPRAYAAAAAALGSPPEEIVFLDDMPWNVRGGAEAGMTALLVDLREPGEAFARAREALLGRAPDGRTALSSGGVG